jgi:O-6-methylguanine DNA methyltransferase
MDITKFISGCRTTKIYCLPDCPAGRRMKPENKIYFRSKKEARDKGYRACRICKPDKARREPEIFLFSRYESPIGPYFLAGSTDGIVCIKTEEQAEKVFARWKREKVTLKENLSAHADVMKQLDEYFAGKRMHFTVPLDLRGTPFQSRVWDMLSRIPWGESRSYRQIAEAIGRPSAARAVGRAVGTNPVSIIVPCHRILGSSGKLTGYGGGLERKAALLKLECIPYNES